MLYPKTLSTQDLIDPLDLSPLQNIKPVWCWSNKQYKLLNLPCAFDIETTSFMVGNEKRATMYSWCFGIDGYTWMGRTWESFKLFLSGVCEYFGIDMKHRLYVGVHNLSYEFQFMMYQFNWSKVFAVDAHKPVYVVTDFGVEFHCTYLLSGYSLGKLGSTLTKYKCEKMLGDLDYSLKRNSKTSLTDKELGYIHNDVYLLMCWIQERIEEYGVLSILPITKTGVVREFCRNACFYEPGEPHQRSRKKQRYTAMIHSLTLTVADYEQLKRAFAGGYTHADAYQVGKVLHDVSSYDLTSAYPTQLVAERYPMSAPEHIVIESNKDLEYSLAHYCCCFEAVFTGIEASFMFDHYISASHCYVLQGQIEDNGRVVSADKLAITLTEVDYDIIRRTYTWQDLTISNFTRYKKGYLPKDFVLSILHFYESKTKLKGVQGREYDLLKSKEMLNSCYGMAVTDICRDDIIFTDDWEIRLADKEKTINKYNRSYSRFLYYPWGIWCTAYCRRTIWAAIMELGPDYVYSDTDSVKLLHGDKHTAYFDNYNRWISKRLEKAMDYHQISYDLIRPKNIKGKEKQLGVFDYEGTYTHFKTLGAKRYMTAEPEGYDFTRSTGEVEHYPISLTVAGLNKAEAIPYLMRKYAPDGDFIKVFDRFSDELEIPASDTGKNCHTYISEEIEGELTDYMGNTAHYHEKSYIHLSPINFSMKISARYKEFINSIIEMEDPE